MSFPRLLTRGFDVDGPVCMVYQIGKLSGFAVGSVADGDEVGSKVADTVGELVASRRN